MKNGSGKMPKGGAAIKNVPGTQEIGEMANLNGKGE
jgi:hypothetical protein